MSSKLQKFLQVKKLLMLMEADLGFDDLKQDERDLLAAILDIQKDDGSFESDILIAHDLARRLSNATFFRTLRSLQDKGYIIKSDGRQRNLYELVSQPTY
jgi:secreted Zn-dependent insulinase-like peptidase